ncbi:hypothetical protein QJR26_04365 [Clostridium baratii]
MKEKTFEEIKDEDCVYFGAVEEPVITLGFTRAGLGVDYKGNAINDDISFPDIGFIKENFKIEK